MSKLFNIGKLKTFSQSRTTKDKLIVTSDFPGNNNDSQYLLPISTLENPSTLIVDKGQETISELNSNLAIRGYDSVRDEYLGIILTINSVKKGYYRIYNVAPTNAPHTVIFPSSVLPSPTTELQILPGHYVDLYIDSSNNIYRTNSVKTSVRARTPVGDPAVSLEEEHFLSFDNTGNSLINLNSEDSTILDIALPGTFKIDAYIILNSATPITVDQIYNSVGLHFGPIKYNNFPLVLSDYIDGKQNIYFSTEVAVHQFLSFRASIKALENISYERCDFNIEYTW